MTLATAIFAGLFALIHVGIGKLTVLDHTPRSRWLSAAGGVAVAYVFLHILPELASHRQTFAEALGASEALSEKLVYLVALAGLGVFYGLERAVKLSRDKSHRDGGARLFWVHIGSFGLYNVIIGYLLMHREESGYWSLLIYGVAIGLHFVTNDFGLRRDHADRYDRMARWILAGSVLCGWVLGAVTSLPEISVALMFAFLVGGIILNVLKEELPEERQSRFAPFLFGCAGYAALLVAI